jgi:ABC transporter substrate binding protein
LEHLDLKTGRFRTLRLLIIARAAQLAPYRERFSPVAQLGTAASRQQSPLWVQERTCSSATFGERIGDRLRLPASAARREHSAQSVFPVSSAPRLQGSVKPTKAGWPRPWSIMAGASLTGASGPQSLRTAAPASPARPLAGRLEPSKEVLKQAAPHIARVGVLRDSSQVGGVGQFSAIQSVAPSFGIDVVPINVRDAEGIEGAIAAFARSANGGLIVTASALAQIHRDLIFASAAKHRLPAVYWDRALVTRGGLMSYGPDLRDQFRLAATYVDRILKGEKPADLPVQAPTKFATVINLRAAKAIGLEMPAMLLARADEVIE